MAMAPRQKITRAELERIFVLDETGEMSAEYSLDPDCPIEFEDFLRVLPQDGIGHRESLFVGEYVFTAFQSGGSVFVLLSRGQMETDDLEWIALLLNAAYAQSAARPPRVSAEEPSTVPDAKLAGREERLRARESDIARAEAKLRADEAKLRGRAEELERLKAEVGRALEVSKLRQGASAADRSVADAAVARAQASIAAERESFASEKAQIVAKLREAVDQVGSLRKSYDETRATLERERAEAAAREAEAEKLRLAIEGRVQELSQRFAEMAKERLLAVQRSATEPPEPVKQAIEFEKSQLAQERKFLQKRAIEVLDKEEEVREREAELTARETALRQREADLLAQEAELGRPSMPSGPAPSGGGDSTVDLTKDLDKRVKTIEERALELADREEKLRKRAADLQQLEDRLAGKVPADS